MTAAAPVITETAFHTFQRLCYCRTRYGELIATNGLNRGFRWDGISTYVEDLGIDAPAAAATVASVSGGSGTFAEEYILCYRYIDDTLPTGIPSSISANATNTPAAADYKFNWTGLSASSQSRVSKVELYRTEASGNNVLYLVKTLGHNGTITSVASNGGFAQYTCNETHNLAVGAIVAITGTDAPDADAVVTAVNASNKTFTTDTAAATGSTDGTWQLTGYNGDDESDADIVDNDYILIVEEDGQVSSRRFTAPPDWAAYVTMHQDVYWYFGPVNYNEGTVATDGTTTITFSGATLTAQMAGRYIRIDGETEPFSISSVNVGAGTAVISPAPSNTDSGLSYSIYTDPSNRRKLRYTATDEAESCPATYTVTIQENIADDDEITGGKPWGLYQYIFMERSKYIVTFVRQPRIDAHVSFVDDRGAFNHFCATDFEDTIYCMDEQGPYRFGNNVRSVSLATSDPIGMNILDLWRDTTGDYIDFSKSKYFFTEADHTNERINFHVCFVGDTGNYPQRMLSYNVRRETWDKMVYLHPLGSSCSISISGKRHVLVGGKRGQISYLDNGAVDVVTAVVTGTATAGGNTTLTDSGASFTSAVVDAPVAITSGTGKGQVRLVSAQTSTQLTVSVAWDTNPSTDSVYAVGAIKWSWKSPRLKLVDLVDGNNARSLRIHYDPTTNANNLDARYYFNHGSSPESHSFDLDMGDGVSIDQEVATDVVFDLKLTRSSLDNASGFLQHYFPGRLNDRVQGDRYVQVELRGFQVNDRIVLHEVTIFGVTQ